MKKACSVQYEAVKGGHVYGPFRKKSLIICAENQT